MLRKFTVQLDTLLSNRIDEINEEVIFTDDEYRSLTKVIRKLHSEILTYLPDNLKVKELLEHYDEVSGKRECVSQLIIYKQGLKDGRSLKMQV